MTKAPIKQIAARRNGPSHRVFTLLKRLSRNENHMRQITFLLIVSVLISCHSKNNDQGSHDTLYSVDTLLIDSKGQPLYLKYQLINSSIDEEKRSIYLFNDFNHSIDEVNLDELALVNNYPFETEGPDGTGEPVNNFNVLKDGRFFIKSFSKSGVFDRSGALKQKIDWTNSMDSTDIKYGEAPEIELLSEHTGLTVFGLNYDYKNREIGLDVLSVQKNVVKRFEIDAERSYRDFILTVEGTQYVLDPNVFLVVENNSIIISHQFSNEVLLFNSEGGFIKKVDYEPKLTPKRVNKGNEKGLADLKQVREEYKNYLGQVCFYPPVWDEVNKRYLRLSTKSVYSEKESKNSFLPEVQESKAYLSVFDVDFNLVSELPIPELTMKPTKYFAKDGKLWVFKNFSDELGFIVVNI